MYLFNSLSSLATGLNMILSLLQSPTVSLSPLRPFVIANGLSGDNDLWLAQSIYTPVNNIIMG